MPPIPRPLSPGALCTKYFAVGLGPLRLGARVPEGFGPAAKYLVPSMPGWLGAGPRYQEHAVFGNLGIVKTAGLTHARSGHFLMRIIDPCLLRPGYFLAVFPNRSTWLSMWSWIGSMGSTLLREQGWQYVEMSTLRHLLAPQKLVVATKAMKLRSIF